MIGRVISGRYVVQAIVGTGGMAVVYRAFDKKKNRIVAIKVLRPEYESDEEFVRRFSREAEAASKVSHENIVNMLDVGTDGDVRYIVMEFVDGQTLKDMIRQQGCINPDTAIRMTIRILAAVDHAHRNGIVHRDIKPQNILVDSEGRVKVADFGIARLKATQTTTVEEGPGVSALGSVHYFSPEQAKGEVADEKSDLYSVGVVMYEMLTGQVPFDGETSVSVALKHVNEAPKSMREHREGISVALDEVVMRALCKDATKRYQSAAEMAADLAQVHHQPRGRLREVPPHPGGDRARAGGPQAQARQGPQAGAADLHRRRHADHRGADRLHGVVRVPVRTYLQHARRGGRGADDGPGHPGAAARHHRGGIRLQRGLRGRHRHEPVPPGRGAGEVRRAHHADGQPGLRVVLHGGLPGPQGRRGGGAALRRGRGNHRCELRAVRQRAGHHRGLPARARHPEQGDPGEDHRQRPAGADPRADGLEPGERPA